MRRIKRQRQPGADADVEDALAGRQPSALTTLAARLKDGAEQRVVDARVAA